MTSRWLRLIGLFGLVAVLSTVATLSPKAASAQPAALEGLWQQIGADIDGEATYDESGWSVAMSADGNTVIIGAPYNGGNGSSAGHARVFRLSGDSWTQLGADIDGEFAGDRSGESVAISADGNTVIIGASGNFANVGHARVFRLSGDSWVQVGDDIDGEAGRGFSGESVAMSADGNTVIIGAPSNDGNGDFAGHARVFRLSDGGWVQVGADIDGEAANDDSGTSVAMSADGNTVIIGAPSNDGNGSRAGHARVFRLSGGDWVQVGADIDGEAPWDSSGEAVAMSSDGNTVIIGAPWNDPGHARVFRLSGDSWVQVGDDIDGAAVDDFFGESVAMSSDGNTVMIGAPQSDANGRSAGHARVFRLRGDSWVQVSDGVGGEAAYDDSGQSVAISADGTTVVVGAPSNDGIGDWAGHARVFRFAEGAGALVGDRVWDDLNGDGLQSPDEPGVAGVRVDLLNGDSVVRSVTTNTNGFWTQRVDPAIEWKIRVTAPLGRTFTTRDVGTNDNRDSDVYPFGRTARIPVGTLSTGETNRSFDAGLAPVVADAVIGNRVWDDLNGNGRQNAGEPGVAGVQIELMTDNVVIHTITTNRTGFWTHPVDPTLEWKIRITAPDGRTFTKRNAGTNDNRDSDVYIGNGATVIPAGTLTSGETNKSFDAGLAPA